ncbi:MAG: hypothetical protein RJB66_211 [Pseudomonadota bacterium]|jgi:SEC-C motif-containing protein
MCYCGTDLDYEKCCGEYIDQGAVPNTAEKLMRSRYSAFVVKNMIYLFNTHDPQTRDQFDLKSNSDWAGSVEFTRLEVLNAKQEANKALVEFRAHFKDLKTGVTSTHHELSKFRQQKGVWYFREGKLIADEPIQAPKS